MIKIITILLLTYLLGSSSYAQVKIGLPAGAPQASAVLDLSNLGDGTRGVALPRVANTGSIINPVNGLLIYDLSSNCTKAYDNGIWSACLSTPSGALGSGVNCNASVLNGNYNQGTALTAANTITIVVNNNTASALTITPSTNDVILSGAAAGMSVTSVSPASVSPSAGGGASTITYTLSGTPAAGGSFTATWSKLGLTCAKMGTVCLTMVPIVVTNTTTPAILPIPAAAGNTIDFVAAGGTPNTSITWAMSSNPTTGLFSSPATGAGATAQAILIAGSTGIVTATFTAVNACGVTLAGTQAVSVSDLSVSTTASAINNFYSQNTALTTANTVTIVLINNSSATKTITPLTADIVLSGAGATGMSVASFSPASLSVVANGGTGTITYTLSGTPITVGAFTATWAKFGLTAAKTNTVCYAIAPITINNVTSPTTLPNPTIAGNTINFTAAAGTPNSTGISWTMTSSPAGLFTNVPSGIGNNAQAVLIAGIVPGNSTISVTYKVTNACGLVVTGPQQYSFDVLRSALVAGGCTSCAAYDAAAADTWVQITAAEYAQIDNLSISPVNIAAANEAAMNAPTDNGWANSSVSAIGPNFSSMPANNYAIAFSGRGVTVQLASTTGFVKYSVNTTSGFNTTGPFLQLNSTPATANFRAYNIMKAPSAVVNATQASYIAIYPGGTQGLGSASSLSSNIFYYNTGNDDPSYGSYAGVPLFQIKYTATKRW